MTWMILPLQSKVDDFWIPESQRPKHEAADHVRCAADQLMFSEMVIQNCWVGSNKFNKLEMVVEAGRRGGRRHPKTAFGGKIRGPVRACELSMIFGL